MKYERLTKRLPSGGVKVENETQWSVLYPQNYTGYDIDAKMMLRLAELEDKIENGTLIELPCKVGDTVYYVSLELGAVKAKVTEIFLRSSLKGLSLSARFIAFDTEVWGFIYECDYNINWFLTKAEAEAKLKELRGEV